MSRQISQNSATFIDLLNNSIVLSQLAPYLPLCSKLALAATCKSIQGILRDASETFRYLDLSYIKSAIIPDGTIDAGGNQWRSQRMDEALTEDEFYGGPLRGIFNRLEKRGILKNVKTLILDGLCVTADLVREIICDDRFDVRILSIREVTHLNDRQLRQALEYAVRPSRPDGTPHLKGLYIFGKMEEDSRMERIVTSASAREDRGHGAPTGVTNSEGAQIGATWNHASQYELLHSLVSSCESSWYQPHGSVIAAPRDHTWAPTVKTCESVIAFDAVLCRGPRHDINVIPSHAIQQYSATESLLQPAVANIALGPEGCKKCGSIWEEPAVFGKSPSHHLPLLAPPPLHSSSVKEAQKPNFTGGQGFPPLFVRCRSCLANRYCERCGKFWDERCLPNPPGIDRNSEVGVAKNCVGCGQTCVQCKNLYIKSCQRCRGGFCILCNEGSTQTACDWCNKTGRRVRLLF